MKAVLKCPCCGQWHEHDLTIEIRQRMVKQENGDHKEIVDIVKITEEGGE